MSEADLFRRLHSERIGLEPDLEAWPIQLGMRGEPWRVLVSCCMLNQTAGSQVRPVLRDFLAVCPTPERAATVIRALPLQVERLLAPLGLQNRRLVSLHRMSERFAHGEWERLDELHGVGRYALDAVAIFVLGRRDVAPEDKVLRQFLEVIKDGDEE